MKILTKCILFVFIAIYVVSPVDAVPGPIDDLIVLLLGVSAQTRIGKST